MRRPTSFCLVSQALPALSAPGPTISTLHVLKDRSSLRSSYEHAVVDFSGVLSGPSVALSNRILVSGGKSPPCLLGLGVHLFSMWR